MGLINALGSIGTSLLNNYAEDKRAQAQRQWSEEMMDKENEWSLNMWNKTNEYNSPTQQVARMTEAGLNPLYYGLDGSSANGIESAQPLNYERASTQGVANPVEAYMQGELYKRQLNLLEAQEKNVNADTDVKEEEKNSYELDNEFRQKTMDARVEAQDLANSLTKENISKINSERDKVLQDIKESVARTDNEMEKKLLIQAETNLKNLEAQQITELLPYTKLLMEAQTDAQKASAAASYMHALYEKKMIDKGYIDAMVKELNSRARSEDARASIDEWEASVKNGTVYGGSETKVGKWFDNAMNEVCSSLSVLNKVLTPFLNIMSKGR